MNDLEKIKKYYGEKVMHLCRSLFSTLLEKENLLFNLLESNFAHSKYLYDDLVENNLEEQFKDYIYSLVDVEKEEIEVLKTPKELLSEVGYELYECKTEEDIQSFKKYYAKNEELCTFNGGRLNNCHVFFAVKKNVNEIKRENFSNPQRQDKYGISVISIQFSKGDRNTLSIKNRYNHRVNNPDATFSNNLENIMPGLTRSFEKEYNLNINQNETNNFELPGYVKANDGKYYKYNYEINNIYYCPDNIIIDIFRVIRDYQEKEKYIIIDYFVVDLVNKKISLYDKTSKDSFEDGLQGIKNIEIKKDRETSEKLLIITFENNTNAYIKIDKYNRIISYYNKNIENIEDNFLMRNKTLEEIDIQNVEFIGNNFLFTNRILSKINLPKVKKIENTFLSANVSIYTINFPNLVEVKDEFLVSNKKIDNINLPNLTSVGNYFLYHNKNLKTINMPNLVRTLSGFLRENEIIEEINLPNLTSVGNYFLCRNKNLKTIDIPNLVMVLSEFLSNNEIIEEINLPNLREAGGGFLASNDNLKELNLPNLILVGDLFLDKNNIISSISLPKIEKIGNCFLYNNRLIEKIDMPCLESIGAGFMFSNYKLNKLNIPKIRFIGDHFLCNNKCLKSLYLPNLQSVGIGFLSYNQELGETIFEIIQKSKKKLLI